MWREITSPLALADVGALIRCKPLVWLAKQRLAPHSASQLLGAHGRVTSRYILETRYVYLEHWTLALRCSAGTLRAI